MSRLGEAHKKLMREIESAFHNILTAEAAIEYEQEPEVLAEALKSAHYFLIEAQKLARWIDSGDAKGYPDNE